MVGPDSVSVDGMPTYSGIGIMHATYRNCAYIVCPSSPFALGLKRYGKSHPHPSTTCDIAWPFCSYRGNPAAMVYRTGE